MGKPVGTRIELSVGECVSLVRHGGGVGRRGHSRLEELVQTGDGIVHSAVAPFGQPGATLIRREQRQLVDLGVGIGDHGVEQPEEV